MTRNILIVDDESNMRWILGRALEQAGYTVHSAASGDEAANLLSREPIDLMLLDLKLKGEDGLTVLRRLRERQPELVVIMLTAYGTVPTAVEAMQLGAADFLRKPFDVEEVTFKIARALERRTMQQELTRLTRYQRAAATFDTLTGTSVAWNRVLDQAQNIAAVDQNALLHGEFGSGRTTLARAIHSASARHTAPLIELDLSIYHPAAQRAALFGTSGDGGAWILAGSGTLILRGLAEANVLPELLVTRFAQQAQDAGPRVLLVGSDSSLLPEVLTAAIPIYIHVPPLRSRSGDVQVLARCFAGERAITTRTLRQLDSYAWPENIAELRSVIIGAAQLAGDDPIDMMHLPTYLQHAPEYPAENGITLPPEGVNLEAVEQELIRQALERAHGNKSKAAELLGLSRHTLLYRMGKYGITAPERL
jgi:DNA-binding NtrC family response regulator